MGGYGSSKFYIFAPIIFVPEDSTVAAIRLVGGRGEPREGICGYLGDRNELLYCHVPPGRPGGSVVIMAGNVSHNIKMISEGEKSLIKFDETLTVNRKESDIYYNLAGPASVPGYSGVLKVVQLFSNVSVKVLQRTGDPPEYLVGKYYNFDSAQYDYTYDHVKLDSHLKVTLLWQNAQSFPRQ